MKDSTSTILEVKDLVKTYPGRPATEALRGVSFSVQKGEIFGILGVNGAGKSTTLNILVNVVSRTSGEVRMFGKDLLEDESGVKQRMNIATAYADLAANLTIYENLMVYAKIYNVPNPKQKIEALLKEFKAEDFRNKRFRQLSAGQRTRANLCKGFINDPEILLLDEPTASLDPSIAADVRDIVRRHQKSRGMTILLTSHNMKEVEEMCDRVALLQAGEIYRIGSPSELIDYLKVPDMEQVFLKLAREETNDD